MRGRSTGTTSGQNGEEARRRGRLPAAAIVPLLPLAALGVAWMLAPVLPGPSLTLVFVVAVLLAAVAQGVWAGLASALLASLIYNFFFIPPVFTFAVAGPPEFFTLGVFVVVAVLTGSVAGRMRQEADAARRHATTVQLLNDFAGQLSAATDREAVLAMAGAQLARTIHRPVVLLAPGYGDALALTGCWPEGQTLSAADWQAAEWSLRTGNVSPQSVEANREQRFEFHPVAGASGTVVVAGFGLTRPATPDEEHAVGAVLKHAGIALARLEHAQQAADAQKSMEQERIRNALLSSLSHDLRTPLATILGAVTSLREFGPSMPEETRADLLGAIEDEAGRLSRFVNNLLDMTRVEAGALAVRRDWVDLGDICRAAAARARRVHPDLRLTIELSGDLPLAFADAGMLEQVLFNLLDNAAKYGEPPVVLGVLPAEGGVALSVSDQGPGIPPSQQPGIFDKFTRAPRSDGSPPGAGLGLAIAQGMVKAMDETLTLESPIRQGRGTRFTILITVPEKPS